MTAPYDFTLHVLATLPLGARAMLLGWAMAITITQPLKFTLPLRWPADTRELLARCVAFVVALATVEIMLRSPIGLALGIITGVWAPFAYWLLLRTIGDRYPKLRDALSGDVRGVLVGQPRSGRDAAD